ncbi:MAG: 3-deoxy-D-manno-octulosonic acid transferase [bacterium]|nr:3-deoxy-D-manno-octulosonic acid transferase [bacterium]
MKLFLYRFLMFILKPMVKPVLFIRRMKGLETKDSIRKVERFGYASVKRPNKKIVWFNAASVGESNSIIPVIDEILKKYPDTFVLVTTTTVTAADGMAKKLSGKNAVHQFLPIDRRAYVDRFFDYWKPSVGFFVDSDFWPNLILSAKDHKIPLILLNGRVSDKSFAKWKNNLPFIKPLASAFEFTFGKSEDDCKKLSTMGFKKPVCVGNLKYAVPPLSYDKEELKNLSSQIGSRHLFVVSSTHPGEEELCISAFMNIKKRFPDVLMVIAPRHPARGEEIKSLIEANGLKAVLRSSGDKITKNVDIYIANTMGELGLFYNLSEIAFVGGSLIKWGGHNPMEPARLHNTVLSGKYVHNFQETYDLLKSEKAVVMVNDEKDFASKVKAFFENPDVAKDYMSRAFYVAEREAAVLSRVMEKLEPVIKKFM